jgi:hypothetical protein
MHASSLLDEKLSTCSSSLHVHVPACSSVLEAQDWDRDSQRMQLCTVNIFFSTTHVFHETTVKSFS